MVKYLYRVWCVNENIHHFQWDLEFDQCPIDSTHTIKDQAIVEVEKLLDEPVT